jgi:hypothetical protein
MALFLVIAVGAGYTAIVALKWDLLVKLAVGDQPSEYTQKDLLHCEPGTHQQNGMCVTNPPSAESPGPAPAAARPASK